MTIDMSHVLDRFNPSFPASIDCGEGWHQLIFDLDAELAEVDPDYKIDQIKEKFGTLRFYYSTNTKRRRLMDSIISQYERLSASTCEISGKDGVLMVKDGYYRTLNMEHAPAGFAPAHIPRGAPFLAKSRNKGE